MTKVQVHYDLAAPLDDSLLERINKANGQWGIQHLTISRSLTEIMVEYDASRLVRADVVSVLRRLGIPAKEKAPVVAEPREEVVADPPKA